MKRRAYVPCKFEHGLSMSELDNNWELDGAYLIIQYTNDLAFLLILDVDQPGCF